MEHKRWSELVPPGAWFHLARIFFVQGRPSRLHTHDFPEIFWIESGIAGHQINETEEQLFPGDMVFIRASDRHRMHPVDAAGFVMVNLAFPARLLAEVMKRDPEIRCLYGDRTELPFRCKLAAVQIAQLREEVRRLTTRELRRIAGERLLLTLYLAALPSPDSPATTLPDWLQNALHSLAQPKHFSAGVPAFVKLCGRSPEYVARTCRSCLGKSPTELVNQIRLTHAARELRLGTRPILDLALESGFGTLAHFYKLFTAEYGTTPRRYRIEHQEVAM